MFYRNTKIHSWAAICAVLAPVVCAGSATAQSPIFDEPVVMPVLTNAPVKNIFVPVGFDDNDTVEVLVHGHFPDSCHKMGPAIGVLDDEARTVDIAARALNYQGNVCIPMEVPFLQSIKLGQVPSGSYNVRLKTASGGPSNPTGEPLAATLNVAKATSSTADDNLYAPVDEVEFVPKVVSSDPTSYTLTLSGIFPRSDQGCMVMQEVKVMPYPNVLVVLPIARFETDVTRCEPSLTPFGRTFRLSKDVKLDLQRDTLIHVRVLNGQSLNRVIEFEN